MVRWLIRAVWLPCLLLQACATQKILPQDIQNRAQRVQQAEAWQLVGRVAVSDGTDGGSGRLEWNTSREEETLEFRAPLGQGGWRLQRLGKAATLDLGDERVYSGNSLSDLLEAQLGWQVPVESMRFWVLGIPDPSSRFEQNLRDDGLPASLDQAGWHVRYDSFRAAGELVLPRKLVAVKDLYSVKLIVSKWETFPLR